MEALKEVACLGLGLRVQPYAVRVQLACPSSLADTNPPGTFYIGY